MLPMIPVRYTGNLEVRVLRIPQAEAVMMLGREADICHPGLLRQVDPLVRIEALRIELRLQRLILRLIHPLPHLNLFMPAGNCVQSQ
jgi:hypothetical protein